MKLFEIIKEIANCIKRVDGDDYINVESGEIIDTEALDALKLERDVKIENIGKWILNLDAEEKALAEQERRFKERKQAVQKKRDDLKNYLAYVLGGKNFKCTSCEMKFRQSEAVVFNGNFKDIPGAYLRYKEPEIDKAKVKKALKAGEKIDGFTLEKRQNLSVA